MSLNEFWLQLLNGVTLGALLFLVCSGFTLIFGLMRIVNLAQGSLYLIGGYVGLSTIRGTDSFWLAVIVRSERITTRGRHRRAASRTCGDIRTRRHFRGRNSRHNWSR